MYYVRGFQSKIDMPSLGNAIIVNNECKININFYSIKCKCVIATLVFVAVGQILLDCLRDVSGQGHPWLIEGKTCRPYYTLCVARTNEIPVPCVLGHIIRSTSTLSRYFITLIHGPQQVWCFLLSTLVSSIISIYLFLIIVFNVYSRAYTAV